VANPTTFVTAVITLTLQDILSGVQVFDRITPPVVLEAINVQYQGFVNLFTNGTIGFTPVSPVLLFAVAYARNIGPSQVQIQYETTGAILNVATLDAGAMFLYASPKLSGQTIGGTAPGMSAFNLFASNAGFVDTNIEVLLAG